MRLQNSRTMALVRATLIATIALSLMAGSVLAGKPAGSGGGKGKPGGGSTATGSFSLVMVDSTDTVVNWGDDVTFSVTSTATYTFVDVDCYQSGTLVFHQGVGFYAGYPFTQIFSLENWAWTSGAADCNARLYSTNADGSNAKTLATMSFYVNP